MRSVVALAAALAVAVLSWGGSARAQPTDTRPRPSPTDDTAGDLTAGGDPNFGPVIVIEAVEIIGNRWTSAGLIRAVLPLRAGDTLRAGDARLRDARFKVLSLGFFRDVDVSLRKGTERGKVVLRVAVVERGTVELNKLFFGTTLATPWWLGADLSDRSFLGSGLAVGAAYAYAAEADIRGAAPQWSAQLRVAKPALGGGRLGVHAMVLHTRASEPYRVEGDDSDGSPDDFMAFSYRRTGLRAGIGMRVSPLSQVTIEARVDLLDADLPEAPTRTLADGTTVPIDLALQPGSSRVVTLGVGFDRDTRPDPVLAYRGDRLVAAAEVGASSLGSDYDFATIAARYGRWFPIGGQTHVVSLHLTGGLVLGDAPRYERFYIGDINKLLSPRALGLVVSTLPSHDLLGTTAEEVTYGELLGAFEVEYSYRLFRGRFHVYGGDLFAGAGVFSLSDLGDDSQVGGGGVPADLMFDVGLRLDTAVGIFELTFANALGRVPL